MSAASRNACNMDFTNSMHLSQRQGEPYPRPRTTRTQLGASGCHQHGSTSMRHTRRKCGTAAAVARTAAGRVGSSSFGPTQHAQFQVDPGQHGSCHSWFAPLRRRAGAKRRWQASTALTTLISAFQAATREDLRISKRGAKGGLSATACRLGYGREKGMRGAVEAERSATYIALYGFPTLLVRPHARDRR